MCRIYIPAENSEDWRHLLASPEKHWRDGYSAKSLAESWQNADGFPVDVRKALDESGISAFKNTEMILGIPEYKVALPGGKAASQNDLFVLARGAEGLIVIMVEGKVAEPFGPLVSEWLKGASAGKKKRLSYLCDTLDLQIDQVQSLRYQLLHRAVSALITARKFNTVHALMLVHSLSSDHIGFDDFSTFADLFGAKPEIGKIQSLKKSGGISLYSAWIHSELPAEKPILTGTVTARKCPHCGHHEVGITDSYGRFFALTPGTEVEVKRGDK